MKKYVKWLLVIVGAILILIFAAGIFVSFFLPLDAIKDFAAAKLTDQLRHEVKIKSASFNIFSGIKLNGVAIANARGFSKEPMLSADTLELKYAFLPLFQGKVIVPEINFVKPQILIEKDRHGAFNFSDMLGAPAKSGKVKPAKKEQKAKGPSPAPHGAGARIDLLINNFKISKGRIIYRDYYTGDSGLTGVNLSVSNITLAALKPIDIKFSGNGLYQGKNIPISLSTNVGVDISGDSAKINQLSLTVAGDTLNASGDFGNLKKAPMISLSLSSPKIMLDPFMAIFMGGAPTPAKKQAAPHGALTRSLRQTFSSIPANVSVSANIDLKNIMLKNLKINSLSFDLGLKNKKASLSIKNFEAYKGKLFLKNLAFDLPSLSYSLDTLELHGFTSTPFINDMIDSFLPAFIDMKNNIEGSLDLSLSLSGAGVEMPEVFDNLKASGVVLLSKGRIKRIRSLASIGEQYSINTLKHDMIVGGLRVNASIARKILNVSKLSLQDTDLQTEFHGGLDFNKMEYAPGNRLTLKFGPALTDTLPREFSIFKDEKGMASVDFELQGTLYKPIPSPVLQKPLEAAVGKLKVKIEAKKVEIETKAKEEVEKKLEEEKLRLQEEAKKKVKEIFKF